MQRKLCCHSVELFVSVAIGREAIRATLEILFDRNGYSNVTDYSEV